MADRLSPEERSRVMSRIRSRDTAPELAVRSLLHRQGFRFRLHRKDLPGKPDIVLPKHQAAIFVHGCFWHQHPGCREGRIPGSRRSYWAPKLRRNVERDREARAALERDGWRLREQVPFVLLAELLAGQGERRARKPGRHQIHTVKTTGAEVPDVALVDHTVPARPVRAERLAAPVVELDERSRFESGLLEPQRLAAGSRTEFNN